MSTNVERQFVSPNDAKPNVVRSAYYTPTVDEFHSGFEFEMDAGTGWCNQIFPNPWWNDGGMGGIKTLENCIKGENVRVKRIDKEDCLSLGLELKIWHNGSGYFQKGNYTIGIYGTDLFCTVCQNDYGNNIIRFSGDLKNKSELKRILQQTGCVQS